MAMTSGWGIDPVLIEYEDSYNSYMRWVKFRAAQIELAYMGALVEQIRQLDESVIGDGPGEYTGIFGLRESTPDEPIEWLYTLTQSVRSYRNVIKLAHFYVIV